MWLLCTYTTRLVIICLLSNQWLTCITFADYIICLIIIDLHYFSAHNIVLLQLEIINLYCSYDERLTHTTLICIYIMTTYYTYVIYKCMLYVWQIKYKDCCLITITNYFIYLYEKYFTLSFMNTIRKAYLCYFMSNFNFSDRSILLVRIIYLSFLTNDWPLLLSPAIIHVCLTTMLDFYYSSYLYTWKFYLSLLNDKIYSR